MDFKQVAAIIRREYFETVSSMNEAEKEYLKNKKSHKKREIFQFCAAQEMELSNIGALLGIELYDNDFNIIV